MQDNECMDNCWPGGCPSKFANHVPVFDNFENMEQEAFSKDIQQRKCWPGGADSRFNFPISTVLTRDLLRLKDVQLRLPIIRQKARTTTNAPTISAGNTLLTSLPKNFQEEEEEASHNNEADEETIGAFGLIGEGTDSSVKKVIQLSESQERMRAGVEWLCSPNAIMNKQFAENLEACNTREAADPWMVRSTANRRFQDNEMKPPPIIFSHVHSLAFLTVLRKGDLKLPKHEGRPLCILDSACGAGAVEALLIHFSQELEQSGVSIVHCEPYFPAGRQQVASSNSPASDMLRQIRSNLNRFYPKHMLCQPTKKDVIGSFSQAVINNQNKDCTDSQISAAAVMLAEGPDCGLCDIAAFDMSNSNELAALWSNTVLALRCLNKGGMLFVMLNCLHEPCNFAWLCALKSCFNECHIMKTRACDPSAKHRVVVFSGFCTCDSSDIDWIQLNLANCENWKLHATHVDQRILPTLQTFFDRSIEFETRFRIMRSMLNDGGQHGNDRPFPREGLYDALCSELNVSMESVKSAYSISFVAAPLPLQEESAIQKLRRLKAEAAKQSNASNLSRPNGSTAQSPSAANSATSNKDVHNMPLRTMGNVDAAPGSISGARMQQSASMITKPSRAIPEKQMTDSKPRRSSLSNLISMSSEQATKEAKAKAELSKKQEATMKAEKEAIEHERRRLDATNVAHKQAIAPVQLPKLSQLKEPAPGAKSKENQRKRQQSKNEKRAELIRQQAEASNNSDKQESELGIPHARLVAKHKRQAKKGAKNDTQAEAGGPPLMDGTAPVAKAGQKQSIRRHGKKKQEEDFVVDDDAVDEDSDYEFDDCMSEDSTSSQDISNSKKRKRKVKQKSKKSRAVNSSDDENPVSHQSSSSSPSKNALSTPRAMRNRKSKIISSKISQENDSIDRDIEEDEVDQSNIIHGSRRGRRLRTSSEGIEEGSEAFKVDNQQTNGITLEHSPVNEDEDLPTRKGKLSSKVTVIDSSDEDDAEDVDTVNHDLRAHAREGKVTLKLSKRKSTQSEIDSATENDFTSNVQCETSPNLRAKRARASNEHTSEVRQNGYSGASDSNHRTVKKMRIMADSEDDESSPPKQTQNANDKPGLKLKLKRGADNEGEKQRDAVQQAKRMVASGELGIDSLSESVKLDASKEEMQQAVAEAAKKFGLNALSTAEEIHADDKDAAGQTSARAKSVKLKLKIGQEDT